MCVCVRACVCACVCACVPDTSVDLRECTIEASKFEDTDERNGGRIVGFVAAD